MTRMDRRIEKNRSMKASSRAFKIADISKEVDEAFMDHFFSIQLPIHAM